MKKKKKGKKPDEKFEGFYICEFDHVTWVWRSPKIEAEKGTRFNQYNTAACPRKKKSLLFFCPPQVACTSYRRAGSNRWRGQWIRENWLLRVQRHWIWKPQKLDSDPVRNCTTTEYLTTVCMYSPGRSASSCNNGALNISRPVRMDLSVNGFDQQPTPKSSLL